MFSFHGEGFETIDVKGCKTALFDEESCHSHRTARVAFEAATILATIGVCLVARGRRLAASASLFACGEQHSLKMCEIP